jgi:transposase
MSAALPLRDDYDAARLRNLAKHVSDSRKIRRLLALAAVYDGMNRSDAARVGGMDRQTLRDWVLRFNAQGPEGLSDIKGLGRKSLLNTDQKAELSQIVETGPDRATDAVVRWRRIDLVRVIKERFGVTYKERSISDLLKELGFSHMSGRPKHPAQAPGVIEAFKKTSPPSSAHL